MEENNEGGGLKRKRPRVGEVRPSVGREQSTTPHSPSAPRDGSNYRDRSSDSSGYGNRPNNYGTPREGYNNDRGGYSNNSDRGGYSNNNNNRGGYNNDRNSGGSGYNNARNTGGGYNNDRNSSGGYNNDRGGYNNNRSGGNSNYRPSGGNSYNNGGNREGGYSRNNDGRPQGGGGYSRGGSDNNRSYGSNRPNNNRPSGGNRPQQRVDLPNAGKVISRIKQIIKPVKYKENIDPNTDIRLNKYLANAGVCSRREADGFIEAGVVRVNGVVVSELGAKVKRGDNITFNNNPVSLESKVYVLLNKPKNCVTTSDDPQNRMTVLDLVKNACPERIYPVGRLDRNTTGVLLLTNDGDLASKLMHPKFLKKKIYQVRLDKDVTMEDMQAIADGVMLDDGEIHADSIAYVAEDVLNEVGIEIHSGRNRIVRRLFETLGYQVVKLDRVLFAGLTKKNLTRGRWRYLTEQEVNMLRMGAFE